MALWRDEVNVNLKKLVLLRTIGSESQIQELLSKLTIKLALSAAKGGSNPFILIGKITTSKPSLSWASYPFVTSTIFLKTFWLYLIIKMIKPFLILCIK